MSAASVSPLPSVATGASPPDGYHSKFANWERRSAVRTKPRRRMDRSEPPGGVSRLFFPPESVPALEHPLVAERGDAFRHRLLVLALYQYLHFTTVLEQVAVLPVTADISLNRGGIEIPEAMRGDAFKITTDEAWHAQFCHDFTAELVRATGVPASALVEPRFVSRLAELRETFDPADRRLVDVFFAVVSETLVSALLAGIPNDTRLPGPVRAVIGDHAEDEGRHHAFFRSFLLRAWPQLTPGQRRLIGPRVPEFVATFLLPDASAAAAQLVACGLSTSEAATVVDECYRGRHHDLEPAARATARWFREAGALDDLATYDAFAKAGLLRHR